MIKIKKYKDFLESVSGSEVIGSFGPNYGVQKIPLTLTKKDTQILFSELDSKFYTQGDYQELYINYLKNGGKPLNGLFTKKNLDTLIYYMRNGS